MKIQPTQIKLSNRPNLKLEPNMTRFESKMSNLIYNLDVNLKRYNKPGRSVKCTYNFPNSFEKSENMFMNLSDINGE